MTDGTRVLVVDDKAELAAALADELRARGFDAVALSDSAGALAAISRGTHDALVTDLRMPGHDGLELLAESRRVAPEAPVLIMTAFSAVDTAVEAIRRGAHHYLTKPFAADELALFLERALDEVKVRRESRALTRSLGSSLPSIIGRSAAMQEVVQLVRRLADAEVPVLILGETGTGKGLVARALHGESRRAARPFVSVNCAALPEPLLESELFGHARGSFTGATSSRSGLIASAEGGTLFLDEVGELSLSMQAKLLAVLETGRYRAVGEDRERVADVRVVSATHRDLSRAETFRPDLRYRLEVVSLELPPLRSRPGDLPQLVDHFLGVSLARHPASPVRRLSPGAMAVLAAHDWPGNVRELQHVVERVVLLGGQVEAGPDALPRLVPSGRSPRTDFGDTLVPMRELQRRYAAFVLERCEGHKRRTCETLDIDLKTLNRLLEPPPAT